MKGQFNTPVAEHLKRKGETIEEARARGVEVWRKGVKFSPDVAGEVGDVEEIIQYILNLKELKFNKQLEVYKIIEKLDVPVYFGSKYGMDEPLTPKLAKALGLPEGATFGDFVKKAGEDIEAKSRGVMEGDKNYILDLGGKGQTELGQKFITKYPPKPELNPETDWRDKLKPKPELNPETDWRDKLKPNPNLNHPIDKSQPIPDLSFPTVNPENPGLGKTND